VEFVRDNPGEPVPEETFTHYTHRGHQSSLSAFSIYYDTWHQTRSRNKKPEVVFKLQKMAKNDSWCAKMWTVTQYKVILHIQQSSRGRVFRTKSGRSLMSHVVFGRAPV